MEQNDKVRPHEEQQGGGGVIKCKNGPVKILTSTTKEDVLKLAYVYAPQNQ